MSLVSSKEDEGQGSRVGFPTLMVCSCACMVCVHTCVRVYGHTCQYLRV